uniref:Uncharacterized protein n=1 Tax=Meloidogyne enterolobii TaxID=390850 RepID=A0A6V7VKA3_MELEN|nr:unnamed protein product [Meloidogyne enterolobii]
MPNTSSYVPLMSWYYMGIIGTCVFGTLIATFVLFIHSRKSLMQLPLLECSTISFYVAGFGGLYLNPFRFKRNMG